MSGAGTASICKSREDSVPVRIISLLLLHIATSLDLRLILSTFLTVSSTAKTIFGHDGRHDMPPRGFEDNTAIRLSAVSITLRRVQLCI